jgi:hypothetical protein
VVGPSRIREVIVPESARGATVEGLDRGVQLVTVRGINRRPANGGGDGPWSQAAVVTL